MHGHGHALACILIVPCAKDADVRAAAVRAVDVYWNAASWRVLMGVCVCVVFGG